MAVGFVASLVSHGMSPFAFYRLECSSGDSDVQRENSALKKRTDNGA
jgi:hypothetical protein